MDERAGKSRKGDILISMPCERCVWDVLEVREENPGIIPPITIPVTIGEVELCISPQKSDRFSDKW